jgi:antitoxin component of RelBE/YafQ-DinJ toxin-antitoxin module
MQYNITPEIMYNNHFFVRQKYDIFLLELGLKGGVLWRKMPIYNYYIGRDFKEKEEAEMDKTTWELVTFRCDPDTKERLQHWCVARHLPLSVLLRLVAQRLVINSTSLPSALKDPTREIVTAVNEVDEFIPTIVSQRQVNPRMY